MLSRLQAFRIKNMDLDKNSLWIGVRQLVGRPGFSDEKSLSIESPESYGEGMVSVSEGDQIGLSLRLESVHDGILVSGQISAIARGECVRCLEPCSVELEIDFQELFLFSSSDTEALAVKNDGIDLQSIVRDAIVLELPFQPLCEEVCLGMDPVSGEKHKVPPRESVSNQIDPRWQELTKLFGKDSETPQARKES